MHACTHVCMNVCMHAWLCLKKESDVTKYHLLLWAEQDKKDEQDIPEEAYLQQLREMIQHQILNPLNPKPKP
jgi:hypothetical protein